MVFLQLAGIQFKRVSKRQLPEVYLSALRPQYLRPLHLRSTVIDFRNNNQTKNSTTKCENGKLLMGCTARVQPSSGVDERPRERDVPMIHNTDITVQHYRIYGVLTTLASIWLNKSRYISMPFTHITFLNDTTKPHFSNTVLITDLLVFLKYSLNLLDLFCELKTV